jgi:transposase
LRTSRRSFARWPVGEAVFALSPHVRVYLASQPVDMRAGHDGLFAIVKSWDLNPFSGDLFAFVGKRGDRAKILVWHRGGFLLLYKRLEQGRFRIPTIAPGTRTAMLDATELAMLLDGIDVTRVKRPALWEPPSIAR